MLFSFQYQIVIFLNLIEIGSCRALLKKHKKRPYDSLYQSNAITKKSQIDNLSFFRVYICVNRDVIKRLREGDCLVRKRMTT